MVDVNAAGPRRECVWGAEKAEGMSCVLRSETRQTNDGGLTWVRVEYVVSVARGRE